MKLHALSSLLLTVSPLASAIDNGVARTPALGWSSWNYFVSVTDPHPPPLGWLPIPRPTP